jgi:hypothetical protein
LFWNLKRGDKLMKRNRLAVIVDDIRYVEFNCLLDGHGFQEAKDVIIQVCLSLEEFTCFGHILRTHEFLLSYEGFLEIFDLLDNGVSCD